MHHGQSKRERNTHKVCKKKVNFQKTEGDIFESRGEIKKIAKQGGRCTKTEEIGGIRNLWSMTKKRHQKFVRMRIENVFGKRQHHGLRGDGRP